jgi:hypothetical protein
MKKTAEVVRSLAEGVLVGVAEHGLVDAGGLERRGKRQSKRRRNRLGFWRQELDWIGGGSSQVAGGGSSSWSGGAGGVGSGRIEAAATAADDLVRAPTGGCGGGSGGGSDGTGKAARPLAEGALNCLKMSFLGG